LITAQQLSFPHCFIPLQSVVSLIEAQYLSALSRKDRSAFQGKSRAAKG
jgi:hypothetical protein